MTEPSTTDQPQPEPALPGWVAPSAAPVAASPYRSAGTRAHWLVGLLIANGVASVIAVVLTLSGKGTIVAFEAGAAELADLEAFDSAFAGVGILQLLLYIVTAVVWLAWQSRSVDNESALGVGPSTITPRWSIGWWFVPFANLVMPYRVHREMHDRYHEGVATTGRIVVAWWLAWLLENIVTNVVGRVWTAAETLPELQGGLSLWAVSDLMGVVTAALAVIMVRGIQGRAAILAATPAAPATPDREAPVPTFEDPGSGEALPPAPSQT